MEVAAAFGDAAERYDRSRRLLVPCFDALYGNALEAIDDWAPPPEPRVLDLGAGTGQFTAMVQPHLPAASFHLIDVAGPMLAIARDRFKDDPSVTFSVEDFATASLTGPWDLVLSGLAIHHLDDAAKQSLFRRIRENLTPGGLFINAEQVLGPSLVAEARNHRLWQAQCRALGVPETELSAARERMKFDRCAPVEAHLRWLAEAGFAEVDCTFKAWRFAVIIGRRA
jgi:SAM-dependent methyltransferase